MTMDRMSGVRFPQMALATAPQKKTPKGRNKGASKIAKATLHLEKTNARKFWKSTVPVPSFGFKSCSQTLTYQTKQGFPVAAHSQVSCLLYGELTDSG